MESVFVVFSPGRLANTSAGGAGYVGVGTLSACLCARDGCRDACRPMFSSEIFPAGFFGDRGSCRDLCCDACCDGRMPRPVEALPLSERLGHTLGMPRPVEALPLSERLGHTLGMPGVCCDDGCDELRLVEALPLSERLGRTLLGVMEGFAAIVYKMSEAALLGLGRRESIRLLAMFEVASLAWGMNSLGAGDAVPRTLCLDEMVPNGTSLPSRPAHVLPPSAPPPGLPRRADGLPWATRCSPEEWAAWCRVREGSTSRTIFLRWCRSSLRLLGKRRGGF